MPVHWRKPTLSTRILDPGELQRNLLHQGSSPFSIPLPEANQYQVYTVCSFRDVTCLELRVDEADLFFLHLWDKST